MTLCTVSSLSPDKAKRKRSKNYDPHDIELCYALMDEHDPTQLLASAKWAADARQLKEQILNTIYTNFVQRATAKTITLPQVRVPFQSRYLRFLDAFAGAVLGYPVLDDVIDFLHLSSASC